MDSVKKGRVGGRAERARDVRGEGSIFEVKDRGVVGLMENAEISGAIVGACSGGEGGREGGMWSHHTFSSACLEPTRTGVGSPGAKMESEVGVGKQEPED